MEWRGVKGNKGLDWPTCSVVKDLQTLGFLEQLIPLILARLDGKGFVDGSRWQLGKTNTACDRYRATLSLPYCRGLGVSGLVGALE